MTERGGQVEFDVHVRSLDLTNYRNFRRLALTLEEGPTIIQADNAQGKTNLLEAVELLATTKSSRAGSDRELIHWDALKGGDDSPASFGRFARISAVVARESGDLRVEVVIRPAEPSENGVGPAAVKLLRLNGLARRAVDFIGQVNVVSFAPADVLLVAGPPHGRRRYLDVTNSQMNSRYLRALQRYTKVLAQRNHLLRHMREERRIDPSLAVWDEELAGSGAVLVEERARSVVALSERADWWFEELGGYRRRLEVRYRPAMGGLEAEALEGISASQAEEHVRNVFVAALGRWRPRELAAGISLIGPHRDDLLFVLDGADLNIYGSRGQQRLAALSLKLAELDLLTERTGSRPILVLDDALSELDQRKQAGVVHAAAGSGQALLTVTNLDVVDRGALPHATILHLQAGALVA